MSCLPQILLSTHCQVTVDSVSTLTVALWEDSQSWLSGGALGPAQAFRRVTEMMLRSLTNSCSLGHLALPCSLIGDRDDRNGNILGINAPQGRTQSRPLGHLESPWNFPGSGGGGLLEAT